MFTAIPSHYQDYTGHQNSFTSFLSSTCRDKLVELPQNVKCTPQVGIYNVISVVVISASVLRVCKKLPHQTYSKLNFYTGRQWKQKRNTLLLLPLRRLPNSENEFQLMKLLPRRNLISTNIWWSKGHRKKFLRQQGQSSSKNRNLTNSGAEGFALSKVCTNRLPPTHKQSAFWSI